MKKLVLTLYIFCPYLLYAQQSFTVLAKVGRDNAPAKAYLLYRDGQRIVTDSTQLINGSFKFSGVIHEPVPARLIVDHKGIGFSKTTNTADMTMMFLDKGIIHIKSPDSLKRAIYPGSIINTEYKKYTTYMEPLNREYQEMVRRSREATKEERMDAGFNKRIQQESDDIDKRYRARQLAYVKANPDTYVSLSVLKEVSVPVVNIPVVEPLFNGLSERLKNSAAGKELKVMMDKRRALGLGQHAPAFTQNDQNGHPVSLSDFKGKYVLIDFWASWCRPCRAENPNVVKAYHQYKGKNFTVLSVSLDRPGKKEDWLKAIKDDGLEWTNVSDLKYWDNEVAKLYGIRSVPQNFLLDKEGKIIAEDLRGTDLTDKLKEILE